MPQRDGIELLLEIRRAPLDNSVAIIMLSNSEEPELALECVRAGAQDFLLKSEVTASRLERAILQSQARFVLEQKLDNSFQKAKVLAEQDSLTGLANRYSFEEALSASITQKPRDNAKIALTLFDLDNFKFINDTHGHDVGDELLKQVAKRVSNCLRGNEVFARLGGDEFAIILGNLHSIDNATRVTKRILSSIEAPFFISGINIKMSASIGIAIYPDNSVDANELLKFADIAMYRAKKLGRNQICYFEGDMQAQFLQRYQTEASLIGALTRNEFVLHYQPIYQLSTNKLTGFEALMRWNDQNTLQYPKSFLEIAECSGVINDIGRWVIQQSFYQLSTWNLKTSDPLSIAINLSPVQIKDKSLLAFIKSMLVQYNVAPELVEFELTETVLLEKNDETIDFLSSLKQLGCKLSLDDFGIGFSSLSHLQNFPIDVVKIDKTLIINSHETKIHKLITGICLMLQTIDIEIVAEGIENESSLNFCQQLNIARGQGYFFTKPLDALSIESKFI